MDLRTGSLLGPGLKAPWIKHAHAQKIIHRDIKPSNLILDREGRLQILDFGLAHLEGQETLTTSRDVVGTPLYMSPEQARRKKIPIDHRTDIYSLGATLYEMLALRPPFQGKDHNDTISQIIERDPREPRKLNPRVPRDLETIVLKCLRKEPADRYGTAEALGQDMRRFVRGDAIEARPQSRWEHSLRRAWRLRSKIAAFMVLAFAGIACAILGFQYIRSNQERSLRDYEAMVLRTVGSVDLAALGWRLGLETQTLPWPDDRWLDGPIQSLLEAEALLPDRPDAPFHRARPCSIPGRKPKPSRPSTGCSRASRASFQPWSSRRRCLIGGRKRMPPRSSSPMHGRSPKASGMPNGSLE
ncbi:MAG: serine/threonine protein kinase [Planctomycetes bacterium]|nr:serine/threonine protein kinase [Planctomycetota bacterium]